MMKTLTRLLLFLLLPLLAACGSRRHAEATASLPTPAEGTAPGQTVVPAETESGGELTARLRVSLASGGKDVSLGGTLRMKRDDVIQVSLVTFGILEVARLEMTKDYFLLIDKMGKRFVKAAYADVPFLRKNSIDFRTIQEYFWDEQTSRHLAWERSAYVSVEGRSLPTRHVITLPLGSRTARAELTLSGLAADGDWEKRTPVPSRYTEVPADELVTRILNLSL